MPGTAPGEDDHPARVRAVVHGRVQGVGFRWATRRHLDDLGLEGEAENQADGTVVVTAHGPRGAVDQLLERLREDSPGRVERVDVTHPAT